ncbi:MAG: HAD family hydrolase [Flavobacterium sp.]|nr:MAG: HAD family hydrolase [Flavobacterium sp.]
MPSATIVFDLDDTLVKEIDYLKSAFREIASDAGNIGLYDQMMEWYYAKQNVFGNLEEQLGKPVKERFRQLYRNHFPDFDKQSVNRDLLLELKSEGFKVGMVTDGYSVTQRNKLRALDIEDIFDLVIVSEEFGSTKPDERNFAVFHQFNTDRYFYVSDNVAKDFIAPNSLGWTTICLIDDGNNIHPQDFDREPQYLPHFKVGHLQEIRNYIH